MKLIPTILLLVSLCKSSNDPVDLTEVDFDAFLRGTSAFVKFYSPSCPHCVKLAPVWEKVANMAPSYPQPFQVGNVDCSSESLLCERVGVRGVPTLMFFNDGKMYKYKGPREYNDIMKFGAGDYRDSGDIASLPAPLTGGVVHAAKYTVYKLIKDVHAVIRFNVWVVCFIFFVGFAMGSMVAMIFAMATFKDSPLHEDPVSSQPNQQESEKPLAEKKTD